MKTNRELTEYLGHIERLKQNLEKIGQYLSKEKQVDETISSAARTDQIFSAVIFDAINELAKKETEEYKKSIAIQDDVIKDKKLSQNSIGYSKIVEYINSKPAITRMKFCCELGIPVICGIAKELEENYSHFKDFAFMREDNESFRKKRMMLNMIYQVMRKNGYVSNNQQKRLPQSLESKCFKSGLFFRSTEIISSDKEKILRQSSNMKDLTSFLRSEESIERMKLCCELQIPALSAVVKRLELDYINYNDTDFGNNRKTLRILVRSLIQQIMEENGYVAVAVRSGIPKKLNSKYFEKEKIYVKSKDSEKDTEKTFFDKSANIILLETLNDLSKKEDKMSEKNIPNLDYNIAQRENGNMSGYDKVNHFLRSEDVFTRLKFCSELGVPALCGVIKELEDNYSHFEDFVFTGEDIVSRKNKQGITSAIRQIMLANQYTLIPKKARRRIPEELESKYFKSGITYRPIVESYIGSEKTFLESDANDLLKLLHSKETMERMKLCCELEIPALSAVAKCLETDYSNFINLDGTDDGKVSRIVIHLLVQQVLEEKGYVVAKRRVRIPDNLGCRYFERGIVFRLK